MNTPKRNFLDKEKFEISHFPESSLFITLSIRYENISMRFLTDINFQKYESSAESGTENIPFHRYPAVSS